MSNNIDNDDEVNHHHLEFQQVPDAFRGVLASLQHVVPKWNRLQSFTSASKTAPSNNNTANNNNSSNSSSTTTMVATSRSMIAHTPSHNNYASTGDLRVLCAMGGGVGEMHDNALRDYFFTELANPASPFSKSADDLLLIVVPTAAACPKNNYPIPPTLNNNNNNNICNESPPGSSTSSSASPTASSSSEQQQQQKQSVGDKITGAFKMFAKKISNAVSSKNENDSNSQQQQQNNTESSSQNGSSSTASTTTSASLIKNAPPFLSLQTATHICADSYDPVSAGEYSIKSSTISVFRRGINPLQGAVDQSLEYVKKLDEIHDRQFSAHHQSNPRRRGSSSSNLSQRGFESNNGSTLSPPVASHQLIDGANNNNNDGDGDAEDSKNGGLDELRRSSNNLTHQAFLADPPVKRLSSSEFDSPSEPNNSNNHSTINNSFSSTAAFHTTNNSFNNNHLFQPIQYPTAPKVTQILSIPREPNWFATVALNLACQWPFYLNVAVVKMLRSPDFANVNTPTPVAIRTVQRQVYPTLHPPRSIVSAVGKSNSFRDAREASAQDDEMKMQYPDLHYSVDDFEEAFGDIRLAPGHKLAVLLTAGGPPNSDSDAVAVFRGVVNYENLMTQLKKQEQATGIAIASRPGATNANTSNSFSGADFSTSSSSSSALFGPPAVVPLKSQSGRAEVAIWLTEADVEAMTKGSTSSSPSVMGGSQNAGVARGLQGTEILHCALTRVSLHVSHVVSAMLQSVPWASLHASWLPRQTANPVTKNKWMIFPPNRETLTKWLDDDANFNRARAAAGSGTSSDDVKRLLMTE